MLLKRGCPMSGKALSEVRVLDLTSYIAGPYCTKLLADLGAQVVKIEVPGGDPTRVYGPFPKDEPDREKGGLFLFLNTNKRSITLNLALPTGRELFMRLVSEADVLV
jgi:CoA:oxalate CoA-transferase